MKCSEVEKKLVAFFENDLPQHSRLAIEDHLKSCLKCSELVQKFSQIWNDPENSERIKPNLFFLTRLKQRIDEYEMRKSSPLAWLNGLMNGLRPAVAVAVLIAGIFVGNWLGSFPEFNNQINRQETAMNQFLRYQMGDLPSGSIEMFYMRPGYTR